MARWQDAPEASDGKWKNAPEVGGELPHPQAGALPEYLQKTVARRNFDIQEAAKAQSFQRAMENLRERRRGMSEQELESEVLRNFDPETGLFVDPDAGMGQLQAAGMGAATTAFADIPGLLAEAGRLQQAPMLALGDIVTASAQDQEPSLRGLGMAAQRFLPTGETREFLSGQLRDAGIGYQSRTELPEHLRPAAAFGETLAGGMMLTPPVRGAQASLAGARSVAPGFVHQTSNLGAAVGAAGAESIDPGDPLTRFTAEMAGAGAYPLYLASRHVAGYQPDVAGSLRDRIKSLSSGEMRDDIAAKTLVQQLRRQGEDPAVVATAAREAAQRGGRFTADVETGSQALVELRNDLIRRVPGLKKSFTEQNATELQRIADEAETAARAGGEDGLLTAATKYRDMFDNVLTKYQTAAEDRALELAAKLGKDPSEQARLAGERVSKAVNEAYRAASKFESSLWNKLPTNIKIPGDNTMDGYRAAQREILPGAQAFDADTERFIKQYVVEGIASSGDMLRLYHGLRSRARDLASGPNPNRQEARRYNNFADAVLDDLAVVPGSEAARAASVAKHDAFSRTYAGEAVLNRQGSGAERLDPETIAARTTEGGAMGVQPIVRSREIREAAAFDPRQRGFEVPQEMAELSPDVIAARRTEAQGGIEDVATARMAQTVDPLTGRVRPAQLAEELRATQSMDVPQARQAGEQALQAETAAQRASERAQRLSDRVNDPAQSVIARIANRPGQSTADIVKATLKRGDADQEFARLAKIAGSKRLSPEDRTAALDNLREGTLQTMMDQSRNKLGETSFVQLQANMTKPVRTGKPSAMDILQDSGTITPEHAQNMRRFLKRAADAEKAIKAKGAGGISDLTDPSEVQSFVVRVMGARFGSMLGKMLPGPGNIQTPGFAAKLAEGSMRKYMPQFNIDETLALAMRDPETLALLLERPVAQRAMKMPERRKFQRITAAMVQAGIIPKESYDAEFGEE